MFIFKPEHVKFKHDHVLVQHDRVSKCVTPGPFIFGFETDHV
jgi:hypothetical protein